MKRFQLSPKLVVVFDAVNSWLTDNPTPEEVENDLMYALGLLVANEIVECRDQHFHFEADGSVLVFEDEAEAVEYWNTKLEEVHDRLMEQPIDPNGKVN